jgi:hypothetical protein
MGQSIGGVMSGTRIAAALAGVGCAAYGIVGLVGATSDRSLTSAVKWLVGGALAHDLVIAPIVVCAGVLLARLLPGKVRPYVQSGLFITAALTLVGLPFLSGRGYRATNPSALALNYGRGYGIAVGIVWLLVAAVALLRTRHRAKKATPD